MSDEPQALQRASTLWILLKVSTSEGSRFLLMPDVPLVNTTLLKQLTYISVALRNVDFDRELRLLLVAAADRLADAIGHCLVGARDLDPAAASLRYEKP